MLYNIDFDIAASVISLFIIFYIFRKKGLKTAANRFFLALVTANLAACLADIFSSIVNSRPDVEALWKADIWNTLYLALHNTMPLLLLFYCLCLLGRYGKLRRAGKLLICAPVLFDYLLLLVNPLFRFIYYYDEQGIYLHGDLFLLFYVIAFGYMAGTVILLMRGRRSIPTAKRYPLIFIILSTVAALIVQIIFPHILIEIFAQSVGFLGILLSIENQDDIVNPVTRVLNRYAFLETAPGSLNAKNAVFFVIKLPELSYYNTAVGIAHTNLLLREVAMWLSRLDARLSCYDLENGHFVLLGTEIRAEEREELQTKITERFRRSWGRKGTGMLLPVQLCTGSFGTGGGSKAAFESGREKEEKDKAGKLKDGVSSMEELLLIADSHFEGNEIQVVEPHEMIAKHKRRILIEQLLKQAIEEKLFQVYYQPIWERSSGKFHSAEALIRLQTTEFGFISPEEFIPIAEETGQIIEIGAYVFDEVCRFYKSHQLESLGVDYVEVNLSTVQCMDQELVENFKETLKKYQISSERINLEITESAAAGNRRALNDNVNVLNGLGFTFSLDDYGTGYSNFSYMFDLPFSIIKLDKSILWRAKHPKTGDGPKSSGILLANTIRMMKEMGYHVLVEGVETVEQKLLLEELHCDYFQGYFFSKPVPGDVFIDFIKVVNA